MQVKTTELKRRLERLYRTFNLDYLATDPLEYLHRFRDPGDIEIAGLIASSLAYGRVDTIKRSIGRVMDAIGPSPRRFVERFDPRTGARLFEGFVHRFSGAREICCLLFYARQMIEMSGSIGEFFLRGYSTDRGNVKEALAAFSGSVLSLDSSQVYGAGPLPPGAGVRFFFPTPEAGSPCKRLNLYLRWMARRGDGLDFGIWKEVDPSMLVIPLDTHVARISRNIGLTARSAPSWAMAEEITEGLRRLDPKDPVKYDFALCRLGILEMCPSRVDPVVCESCLIRKVCVL